MPNALCLLLAEVVKWQTRTLEVRMLKRLAGSSPVLGIPL